MASISAPCRNPCTRRRVLDERDRVRCCGPGDSESPYRASQGPSRGPCSGRRRGRFGAIPERSTRRHNEPILRKAPETLGGIDHRRAPGVHGVGPPLRPRPSVLSGARPCGRLAALGPRARRPGPEDPWGEPRARAGGGSSDTSPLALDDVPERHLGQIKQSGPHRAGRQRPSPLDGQMDPEPGRGRRLCDISVGRGDVIHLINSSSVLGSRHPGTTGSGRE